MSCYTMKFDPTYEGFSEQKNKNQQEARYTAICSYLLLISKKWKVSEKQSFWCQSDHKVIVQFCINSVYPVPASTARSEQKKKSEKLLKKSKSSKTPPRGRYQDFLVRAKNNNNNNNNININCVQAISFRYRNKKGHIQKRTCCDIPIYRYTDIPETDTFSLRPAYCRHKSVSSIGLKGWPRFRARHSTHLV